MSVVERYTSACLRLFSHMSLFELVRYTIVGLILNLVGYLVYLVVTAVWLSPVVTVSLFYPLSVLAGYFAHRRHTFRHKAQGLEGATLVRYVVVYIAGYLINAGLLLIFYKNLGYPHQLVQAVAIFIVAAFLFVAMKLVVFKKNPLLLPSQHDCDPIQ